MKTETEIVRHTPGPWTIHNPAVDTLAVHAGQFSIAEWSTRYTTEELSNARLIAAAPDLLEALQAVVDIADRNTVEFDRAKAALAKARGEM